MNATEKETLLAKIANEYLIAIPNSLSSVSPERKLYGAIVPHFGFDFEVEDRIYWSSTMWTLDTENAKRIQSQNPNLNEQFNALFHVEDNVIRKPLEIDSANLRTLLEQWYSHQD